MDLLKTLSNYPLVFTCSQIVPLLLEAFFKEVEGKADAQVLTVLVPAMLQRLKLIFKVPGYHDAVYRYFILFSTHLKKTIVVNV